MTLTLLLQNLNLLNLDLNLYENLFMYKDLFHYLKDLNSKKSIGNDTHLYLMKNPIILLKFNKVYDIIFHFLLSKLDSNTFNSHNWPLLDKNITREFKNLLFKTLENIKKNDPIGTKFFHNIILRKSFFDDYRGER